MHGAALSILPLLVVSAIGLAQPEATTAPTTGPAIESPKALETRITENLRLLTGNNEAQARAVGARELLNTAAPAAWDRLAVVLRDPADPVAQTAVCQAVAAFPSPPPGVLLDPLIELLGSATPGLQPAVAAAIARYKGPEVIRRLADLTGDRGAPLARRLAAVDALEAMGDEKAAIAVLIGLLDADQPEIVAAALDAIVDSSGADLPTAAAARRWWDENRDLDETAWLRRRNEQLRDRMRRLDSAVDNLTTRLLAALRTAYHDAPDTEKDALLLALLNDPLNEVRGLAVSLVNAMISDRRTVPPEIAARISSMISDPNPEVRRQVAGVVGDLRDRSQAASLLAVLSKENDSRVRAAIVAALGRIGGPGVADAVVAALDDPVPGVVNEAALALAALAEPGGDDDPPSGAIEALQARYDRIGPADHAMREAFLTAMSRIGSPAFRPAFLLALRVDSPPGVRTAAIRGAAVTDDGSTAALLRPMLEDPQAAVRLAATEALGRCGRTEEDLASLAARLDAKRESEESVRTRSWEGILRILRGRTPNEQLAWAGRFNRPDDKSAMTRYADLLTQIDRRLAEQNSAPALRAEVAERLGDANVALGRHAAAAAFFEQALLARGEGVREDGPPILVKAVDAQLAAKNYAGAFELIDRVAAARNGRDLPVPWEDIAGRLEALLADLVARNEPEPAAALAQAVADRITPQTPISPERREALDRRRAAAAAFADDRRIAELLRQLSGDPEAATRAVNGLTGMGRKALPALADEIERRLDGGGGEADAVEVQLVSLVRAIEPRWSGYAPDADGDARRRALADLRSLIDSPAPPPGGPPMGSP